MSRPPVDYDLHPTTFDGLFNSARAQNRRERELGKPLPRSELVVITSDAMLELMSILNALRERQ